MAIREHDLYHGAIVALLMREEPQAVRLLEKSSNERAIFSVDGLPGKSQSTYFYVKHSSSPYLSKRNGSSSWGFTFMSDHLLQLREMLARGESYLVLICGHKSMTNAPFETCVLMSDEVAALIDTHSRKSESIRVELSSGRSFRVSGSFGNGSLSEKRVVPRNRLSELMKPVGMPISAT